MTLADKRLVSIITVCYNSAVTIDRTIKSVLAQNYDNIEYIIIDGASQDNTLERIENYQEEFRDKFNREIRIISEPDKGIYDAMNKGVKKAEGAYVFFLNAGDAFESENVLAKVEDYLGSKKDIFYGNVRKGDQIETYPEVLGKGYLVYREKMVCHQAIFASRKLLLRMPFDTTLKICADRDWLLKAIASGASLQYMKDLVVCSYAPGGVSGSYKNYNKESLFLAEKYGKKPAVLFVKIKRLIGKAVGHKW